MRSAVVLAIAIILVAASLGAGYLAGNSGKRTVTSTSIVVSGVTSSTSSSESTAPPETTSDYNSSLGIELTTALANGTVSEGDGISVYISMANTLSTTNYLAPLNGPRNVFIEPCNPLPLGIEIFQGDYALGNVSQGKALGLLGPNTPISCPAFVSPSSMPPMSSEVVFPANVSLPAGANVTYWGYWSATSGESPGSNGAGESFRPFSAGTYTVEGEDWWGQAALLHFRVVQNQAPFDCATISSDPSFVAYTNATSGQGPLKLDAYYRSPLKNDTFVLALTNTGNSTLTTLDTTSVSFQSILSLFNPDASQVQTWRYYAPNGTLGFPATFYPDECVLVDMTLALPVPFVPLTIYFSDNQSQSFIFGPYGFY